MTFTLAVIGLILAALLLLAWKRESIAKWLNAPDESLSKTYPGEPTEIADAEPNDYKWRQRYFNKEKQ